MRPTGLFSFQRLDVGHRPAGPSFAARWCPLVGILVVIAAAATAEEAAPAIPAALQRIYSAGVPASVDDLRLMDAHQRDLIQRLTPVTVGIEIDIEPTPGIRDSKSGSTQGSGVIISPDGLVLTAAHVAGAPNRKVSVYTSDGQKYRGKTLGTNYDMDAGLIRITPPSTASNSENSPEEKVWPHAEMGDTARLRPGNWCLALGHPGGYQLDRLPSARFGRVLAINYKDDKKDKEVKFIQSIETDCILIGGDSGGPLFDMEGRVVGIHSRIGSQLSKNLHVPMNAYRDSWDRLVRREIWGSLQNLVGRPVIGVLGDRNTEVPRIDQVLPASPAESAGLQPGDLVVRFGDEEVKKFGDLKELVSRRSPGDEVVVVVLRGEKTMEFSLVVGAVHSD